MQISRSILVICPSEHSVNHGYESICFLHTLRKNERLRLVIDLKTLLHAVWKLSEIEEDVKFPQKMVKHLKMQQVGLTNILG